MYFMVPIRLSIVVHVVAQPFFSSVFDYLRTLPAGHVVDGPHAPIPAISRISPTGGCAVSVPCFLRFEFVGSVVGFTGWRILL